MEVPQSLETVASPKPDDARQPILELCQERIGYRFSDKQLLLEALTHASIAAHRLASNERLEFLGDAVLGLCVCRWLFESNPTMSEGELTRLKSSVVSRKSCAEAARRLGIVDCLIVGRGIHRSASVPRSLASDVFEAIVAAVFLDGGLDHADAFVRRGLAQELTAAEECEHAGNYKSSLQQLVQRQHGMSPVYRLVTEQGPDHSKSFCIAVVVDNRQFAAAWGRNKKEAEQRAAGNALAELAEQPVPYPEV